MLRTITIQKRLLAAFGALALLLAITGVFSLQSISKVRAQADFVETAVVPGLSGIGAIGTGINRNRALTMRLLLSLDITQECETFNAINKLREDILKVEKPYEASIFDSQERIIFGKYIESRKKYFELQERALELLRKEELGAAQDLLDQMTPVSNEIELQLGQLEDINNNAAQDARESSIATYESARMAVIILIIVSVAIAVAVSVLIVTCPCALSLATPAAMLAAAGNLARQGLLVRSLPSLESLAAVDTVVFDKTGTLTRDAMTCKAVHTRPGVSREAALACAAGLAAHSLHPLSRALGQLAVQEGVTPLAVQAPQEIAGQGVQAQALPPAGSAKGAASISEGRMRLGSATFCGAAPDAPDATAPTGPVVHLQDAQGWLASFYWQEELRSDALGVIAALQAQGVEVHLLSGDRVAAAQAMGQRLGITHVAGGCSPAGAAAAARGCTRHARRRGRNRSG